MSELPKRYREHATRPDLLAVCIECSGNPEAVIPLSAVEGHEEWHVELATGRVSPGQEHPNGPWPELAVIAPRRSGPAHVIQLWEGTSTGWLYARCELDGCDFNVHAEDPIDLMPVLAAHVARQPQEVQS